MPAFHLGRTVILSLLPIALMAQAAHDVVPVTNWPAPLYWQAGQAEARLADDASANRVASRSLSPAAANSNIGSSALVFVAMTPCRVLDTRSGQGFSGAFGPPSLIGGASRTFPIRSSTGCSISSLARAYSFNVTVIPPGFLGFITVYPTGQSRPNTSTIDDSTGLVLANDAIVPAGSGGSVDVYANNATELIIDINGYYAIPTDVNLNTAIGYLLHLGETQAVLEMILKGGHARYFYHVQLT
jgi:hypothetical protein